MTKERRQFFFKIGAREIITENGKKMKRAKKWRKKEGNK